MKTTSVDHIPVRAHSSVNHENYAKRAAVWNTFETIGYLYRAGILDIKTIFNVGARAINYLLMLAVLAFLGLGLIYLVTSSRRKQASVKRSVPKYFGTVKGSIIKTIVIGDLHELQEIKRSVGISDDLFMHSFYELLKSNELIGTNKGTFEVKNEVKHEWIDYFKVRP